MSCLQRNTPEEPEAHALFTYTWSWSELERVVQDSHCRWECRWTRVHKDRAAHSTSRRTSRKPDRNFEANSRKNLHTVACCTSEYFNLQSSSALVTKSKGIDNKKKILNNNLTPWSYQDNPSRVCPVSRTANLFLTRILRKSRRTFVMPTPTTNTFGFGMVYGHWKFTVIPV